MIRASIGVALASALVVAAAAVAPAHTGGTTGYASITVERGTVRYSLTLPASALPSDLADALRLARDGSARSREQLLDVLRTRIVLHAGSTRCEPGPGSLAPAPFDSPTVTMSVDFACGGPVEELAVQDDIFDALGPDHHTLAKVETPGGTQQFAFAPDSRLARFTVAKAGSGTRGTGSFFLLGVEHILSGYDHLLFLLALLLPGGGLLSLVKIITAFTIAHSITLTLAVLQVVTLPDRLIEAVIALSIAFVAAENVFFAPTVSRRWLVSFGFGLVHGFGFSAALRELGLPRQGLLVSLFGFNAGVEAGQALVIVACLPLLLLLRRTRWAGPAVATCSLAVLAVGLVLFVERAFL
ncbi:MAG TPA: HupE/UreJ family protein [Methylomirabilota bacterium]|nr:HupE/UreJ family protein [Methylomirabilota bacterium]